MEDQRLDKWLWCARFYKTRTLAQEAIKAGHVTVNGQRPKPSKLLAPGHQLTVRRPPYEYHVEVLGIPGQRQSAPLAQTLYAESEASRAARAQLSAQLRLTAVHESNLPGKLDKRARRDRAALKRGAEAPLDTDWND